VGWGGWGAGVGVLNITNEEKKKQRISTKKNLNNNEGEDRGGLMASRRCAISAEKPKHGKKGESVYAICIS